MNQYSIRDILTDVFVLTKMNKLALIVLGMHRSGTSMLSGLLNELDLYLGDQLLEASKDNIKGYFENKAIVLENDSFLISLGLDWSNSLKFSNNIPGYLIDSYKQKIKQLIQTEFKDTDVFVIKDPRLCRLLFLWVDIFNDLNIEPKYLNIIRNPIEVTQSIKTRDGIQPDLSYLSWLNHVVEPLQFIEQGKICFTTYDKMLNNSNAELLRLLTELNITSLYDFKKLKNSNFVDNSLKHQNSLKNRHSGNSYLERVSLEIYNTIEDNIENTEFVYNFLRSKNELFDQIYYYYDGVVKEIQRNKSEYLNIIETNKSEYLNIIETLEKNLSENYKEIKKLVETITLQESEYNRVYAELNQRIENEVKTIMLQEKNYNQSINELEKHLQNHISIIKDLENKIETSNHEKYTTINRLTNDLNNMANQKLIIENQLLNLNTENHTLHEEIKILKGKLANQDDNLDKITSSISWKVTKPLREIKKKIKKK